MFLSPSRALGFLVSINIAAGKGVVFIKCNPSRWSWIGVVKSPMDFFEDGIFVSCSLSLQLVHHYFESVLNFSFPFLSLCTFCSFLFKVIIISNHLRTRSSFVSIKFISNRTFPEFSIFVQNISPLFGKSSAIKLIQSEPKDTRISPDKRLFIRTLASPQRNSNLSSRLISSFEGRGAFNKRNISRRFQSQSASFVRDERLSPVSKATLFTRKQCSQFARGS